SSRYERVEDADRDQDHHGERRGLASVEKSKLDPVDVEAEQLGGRSRAATGEDVDMVEDAEHVGHTEEQDQEKQRPQVMKLDVAELRPPGGPVDLRRLDGLFGNRLQPGKEDEVDEGRPLPDVDARHGAHGEDWDPKPLDLRVRNADRLQHVVQDTVAGRVDQPGHHAPRDGRDDQLHNGQHVERRSQPGALDGAVNQEREAETEEDLGGKNDHGVQPGGAQRVDEEGIAQGPRVVAEADERAVVQRDRLPDRDHEGDRHDDE